MLKVIGHINPDTDSTCSPIVYAWFLKEEQGIDARAFLSGEPNKEALFVLEKFGIEKPEIISEFNEGDELVVIDTNNPDELLPGHDKATIVELIDHHKFAGLTTEAPLKVTMIPLACSATVLWEVMGRDSKIGLPKEIAGLMLAAIVSDTLKFTSPTTTERDIEVAQKLSEIAEVDIDSLAEEMFAAKSDLSGMSARDIIFSDSKVYEMNGKKARMSVLETTAPQNALTMKDELLAAISEIKNEEHLDALFFFVVDIVNNTSTLLSADEMEQGIAEKAFATSFTENEAILDGIVSRKKQMVPKIESVI